MDRPAAAAGEGHRAAKLRIVTINDENLGVHILSLE